MTRSFEEQLRQCLSRHAGNLPERDRRFVQRVYGGGIDQYVDRLKALDFSGKRRILDAGCGFGQWSLAMARLNDQVDAVDVDPRRVAFLSDLAEAVSGGNVTARPSTLTELPFPDSTFDAVFCYGVIFLSPWRDSLKELRRVLKPGGLLYVNANGLGWYAFLWLEEHNRSADYDPRALAARVMENTLKYDREGIAVPGTDVIIDAADLRAELGKCGFDDIVMGHEGTLHLDTTAPVPKPFFRGEYYGLPGVFETVARVGSAACPDRGAERSS